MNDDMTDLDERLSGEYAALRDTPAVMRSAVGYLEELQAACSEMGSGPGACATDQMIAVVKRRLAELDAILESQVREA